MVSSGAERAHGAGSDGLSKVGVTGCTGMVLRGRTVGIVNMQRKQRRGRERTGTRRARERPALRMRKANVGIHVAHTPERTAAVRAVVRRKAIMHLAHVQVEKSRRVERVRTVRASQLRGRSRRGRWRLHARGLAVTGEGGIQGE